MPIPAALLAAAPAAALFASRYAQPASQVASGLLARRSNASGGRNPQVDIFYRERDAIYNALQRGENPYGGYQNAVNSIYNTYGRGSGVSYQQVAGIIKEAYDAAAAAQQSQVSGGYGGYGSYGGYGGYGYSQPAYIRASLQDKIDALNNLYNIISSDINALTQERRKKLEDSYKLQEEDLQAQYAKSSSAIPWSFVARGTRYSSDYENAMREAAETYDRNLRKIAADREEKLAELGRTYAQQIATIEAGRSALAGVNPNFYGTEADLQQARANFDKQISELSTQRAGLGTQAGYLGRLASIAPVENKGASELQAQLQKLSESSIPGFAKKTIAQGLIKQAKPEEQPGLQDYFERLTVGQNTSLLG